MGSCACVSRALPLSHQEHDPVIERPNRKSSEKETNHPRSRPPPLLAHNMCLLNLAGFRLADGSLTLSTVHTAATPPPTFSCSSAVFFFSGLIYEEVLHYHPDQAARFRDAALPATPSAAAADAAGATAAAAASTSRRRPAAEPEEPAVSDSSAAAAKRPAGDTAGLRLQEPDRKRYRLAIEGGGALAREHPMPTAAAKGSAAPDRSAAGAAAAAAVTAALGRSRAGDVEGVWRQ